MVKQMMVPTLGVGVALVAASAWMSSLSASVAAPAMQMMSQENQSGQAPDMKADCQAMMDMRQKMMDDMKASDAELAAIAQRMKTTPGEVKLDVVADQLERMVSQRTMMRQKMMDMQQQMMSHMMNHMMQAMDSGKPDAMHGMMMQCPMMQGGMGSPSDAPRP